MNQGDTLSGWEMPGYFRFILSLFAGKHQGTMLQQILVLLLSLTLVFLFLVIACYDILNELKLNISIYACFSKLCEIFCRYLLIMLQPVKN